MAPIVEVHMHRENLTFSAVLKIVELDHNKLSVHSKDINVAEHFDSSETSLETSVRSSFSHKNRVYIGSLGHINLEARASAGITIFRFVRLCGIYYKREQYIYDNVKCQLLLNGAISSDP